MVRFDFISNVRHSFNTMTGNVAELNANGTIANDVNSKGYQTFYIYNDPIASGGGKAIGLYGIIGRNVEIVGTLVLLASQLSNKVRTMCKYP